MEKKQPFFNRRGSYDTRFSFLTAFPVGSFSVRLNWVYLIRHIQTIKGTVFEIDSDMYK